MQTVATMTSTPIWRAGDLARVGRAAPPTATLSPPSAGPAVLPPPVPLPTSPATPTREERIVCFVRHLEGGALAHARTLAAALAGEMAGVVVGSVALAPAGAWAGRHLDRA